MAARLAAGALALGGLVAQAQAGGFAVREQSTEFQGVSFAGNGAAGGGLSAMFWNPAVAAYAPAGIYTEAHYAVIFGNVEITASDGTTPGLLLLGRESGDIARDAVVPSSYASFRLSERLVAAISVNSPFGLVTEPQQRDWAGRNFARTSEIKTYNFSPTLAYRVTPTVAVGVGLQLQRIEGRLKSAAGLAGAPNAVVQGDDFAFGFTAGINWQAGPGTHIGLGWRSSIDHTLEGTTYIVGQPIPLGARIKAGVTLPDIVTLSLRHQLTDRLTMLGTVEWSHWSRLESLRVVCAQPTPSGLCPGGTGSLVSQLDLGWHDGWFFALGGEWQHSEKMTLRAGIAYELSPIQNADERSLRVPDTDRLWLSLGATYKWSEAISLDFAYTHIFGVGDDAIDRREGPLRFVGNVDADVDIVSASVKIKLGGGEAHAAPLK